MYLLFNKITELYCSLINNCITVFLIFNISIKILLTKLTSSNFG